jgi:hypothetical protein
MNQGWSRHLDGACFLCGRRFESCDEICSLFHFRGIINHRICLKCDLLLKLCKKKPVNGRSSVLLLQKSEEFIDICLSPDTSQNVPIFHEICGVAE